MLIADGTDLNPAMLVALAIVPVADPQGGTTRSSPRGTPWRPCRPRVQGSPQRSVIARFARDAATTGEPATAVRRWSTRSSRGPWPKGSPVAGRGGRIYGGASCSARVLGRRRQAPASTRPLRQAAEADAEPLPAPALESLRQVFHGPDSPPEVPLDPFGELALLPDRPVAGEAQELRNAVQKWLTDGPGAGAGHEPGGRRRRRSSRGSSSAAIPTTWASRSRAGSSRLLAGPIGSPFRDGSGRLELARAIAEPGQPADGPRAGQPRLDAPLRHAPGRHAGRLRPAERAADASRAARPPGRRASWTTAGRSRRCTAGSCSRRTYQQRAPTARTLRARPGEPALLADEPAPARLRGDPRRPLAVSGRLDRRLGGPPMPG